MSVVIRLSKTGRAHRISYRIAVQDRHNKLDGKFIENLGFFNPNNAEGESFKIDKSRFDYWVGFGAKPSHAVTELIEGNGIRPPKPKKPRKDAVAAESAAAQASAPSVPSQPNTQEPS